MRRCDAPSTNPLVGRCGRDATNYCDWWNMAWCNRHAHLYDLALQHAFPMVTERHPEPAR